MIEFYKDWICIYESKFIKRNAITEIDKVPQEDASFAQAFIAIRVDGEDEFVYYKYEEEWEQDFIKLKEWLGCEVQ